MLSKQHVYKWFFFFALLVNYSLSAQPALVWTKLSPANPPSPRFGAPMAFDANSEKLILFGGQAGASPSNQTWTFNTATVQGTWVDLNPTSSPQPSTEASMAYDPTVGKLILFGGTSGSRETQAYNGIANTWTLLTTSGPLARAGASMAFDPSLGEIILFGGTNVATYFDDTWRFNSTSKVWTQLTPAMSPGPRTEAPMAVDPQLHAPVIFGGFLLDVNGEHYFNDTWAFLSDFNTWTNLDPSPPLPAPRAGASMVADPLLNRLILFGGFNKTTGTLYNDTWVFDFISNTWTDVTPTDSPSGRWDASMAFDSVTGRTVLFGGSITLAGNGINDTWSLTTASPPQITSANSTTFTVGQPSSFTVTTTGSPVPTITESGILPTGINFVDHGDGTATLSGTPAVSTGGVYEIIFTAENGNAPNAVQNFTLTIDESPVFTSGNSVTFPEGVFSSFIVTTLGFPKPAITEMGILPTGVMFKDNNDGTATLFGTPSVGTAGSYSLTFTASNGIAPDAMQSFTLTITIPPQSPIITSANAATFQVGTFSSFVVTTTGSPTPSITEIGILPTGVNFVDNGNGTGTLSGTPAVSTGGKYNITFKASNGVPPTASQSFTLTVNESPTITSANATSVPQGFPFVFHVTTTGFPTPMIAEMGALPPGVSFMDNGNGTGTLSGTPSTSGTFPIAFIASNGVSPNAMQNFTLTVTSTTASPTITSANSATFTVGTFSTFTVTTTGSPTPSISETGILPAGVNFLDNGNGTATLSGTPAVSTGGTYKLTFTAINGISPNATQNFTLNVLENPMITSGNAVTFPEGQFSSFIVTTTGNPAPSLAEEGILPTGITFTDNGNGTGTLSGTPAPGTAGRYDITFSAMNGVGPIAIQAFALTITTTSSNPTITSADATSFEVGKFSTFLVTTTGSPTPLIMESGILPAGVNFIDNHNGTATFSGTPSNNTQGVYTITFTAVNGVMPDAFQTFKLTVTESPTITSPSSATFPQQQPINFLITTAAFPTASITESGILPTGVNFVDNGNGTASLTGTPAAGTAGTYELLFMANNGVSPAATQKFMLTITALPESPTITSANSTTFTVGESSTFLITTTGSPTPTIMISGVLPTGVNFVDNGEGTATLSGNPARGSGGVYTITITAANGISPDAVQTFTLTVNENPTITSPNARTQPVGQFFSFTVTTHGFLTPMIMEMGALPAGVTFTDNGNGTATLSGTPQPGSAGVYMITFVASNGINPQAIQLFILTITAFPESPAITSPNSTIFTAGTFSTFEVTTTGSPTPAITQAGILPIGVKFIDNGNGTGTLSGTPAITSQGVFPITFTAANGVSPDAVQNFTLTVEGSPVITSPRTVTFPVGIFASFTVTTSGFPVPTITETGILPAGINFKDNGNGTATLSGIAAAGTAGSYALLLTASNGILPNGTQAFTLIISTTAFSPMFTSPASTTFEVEVFSSFLVTTTGAPPASITESGALPAGVTFVDNGNGTATISGTPAPGTVGTYSLILTAANGVAPNAVQNFTLNVVQAGAQVVLQVSPNPAAFGQPVTLTATVQPAAATGTVTFFDSNQALGTVSLVNGKATLVVPSFSIGTHLLTARYNGNTLFPPATSNAVTLVVEGAQPPINVRGFQKVNRFATQADYVNIISWDAPTQGTTIVEFRIYADKDLKKLLAKVKNHGRLRFRDHERKKGKTYTYSIVSVDQFGNVSTPVVVKVKPIHH